MLNNVTYTKFQEEEKIKEKTKVLAKISHEFKNPLIAVSNLIDEAEEGKNLFNFYRK